MPTQLPVDQRAAALVDAMTLDEQLSLLRSVSGGSLLELGVPLPPTVPESMRRAKPQGALGTAGVAGGSSDPQTYGESFARRGVILVTFNYRLGRLGFFAHPALSREQQREPLGNYGTLDQIAALQWVRRNIARFGGDPERVTAMGQSAGGESVLMLAGSPMAAGLFQRAIVQSGASVRRRSTAVSSKLSAWLSMASSSASRATLGRRALSTSSGWRCFAARKGPCSARMRRQA